MATDNLTKQIEEVEALSSIYGPEWNVDSESSRSYSIKISESNTEVILYITFPSEYPGTAPPKFEISAPWMDRKVKRSLYEMLQEVYNQNKGEPVIYQWVEKVRDFLITLNPLETEEDQVTDQVDPITERLDMLELECPEITHGEVIMDRKSSFQGHAATVISLEQVKIVINKLMTNKKICNATHNMYAYRIERIGSKDSVTMIQDCDDDGETHAGSRMLHLLQILDIKNVIVVVSRWYGGIQLGPDRFRHINNATRQVLIQSGLLKK